MLNKISFKLGSIPGQTPLSLPLKPSVTVFIGPNNSGKSLALKELHAICVSGSETKNNKVIDNISFQSFDEHQAIDLLNQITINPDTGNIASDDFRNVKINGQKLVIYDPSFLSFLREPNSDLTQFTRQYLSHFTMNMDGKARLSILNNAAMGNLLDPSTTLARLYTDDERRSRWRSSILEALGLHVSISNIEGGALSVHFGRTPPQRERTHEPEALDWIRLSSGINGISDGVRAYAGILAELHAGLHRIVMIDEPEAFLHPALARRLGREIAAIASREQRHVFVATHSADFLMGAVLSGALVNVVRLTWDGAQGSARLLDHSSLREMVDDPMLRSVGVFSGLFHKNVVVTEADTDRAFYSEINDRLVEAGDPRAIEHALFLNADNHQTIPRIIAPLRSLGIPAAGIFDLDVLSEGGKTWAQKLKASGFPSLGRPANEGSRAQIYKALTAKAPPDLDPDRARKHFKTNGGIALLDKSDAEAAGNFLAALSQYGMFLVPHGEVEAWLPGLNVPTNKQTWRTSIFKAMGSDPTSPNYLKPSADDVWEFLGAVSAWMVDPSRRGLP